MVVTAPPPERIRVLPDGRYVVPGNRADLLANRWPLEPPTVSVVIPYYREQRRLDLVLAGLGAQTYPRDRLEIVVADDGSPEAPRVDVAGETTVSVVRQPDHGFRAAAARNLGARAASGAVLCFLDGDTVPAPDYVSMLTRLPALLPDALVTGRRRHADLSDMVVDGVRRWFSGQDGAPPELPEPGWLAELNRTSANLLHVDRHSYRAVISAVLGCSAELFAELGGFDETFTAYGGEDWEFGFRALNAGAVLAHEPGAVAWHDGVDWGARHRDAAAARAEKDRENAALALRIPGVTSSLPTGPCPPDVVVHVSAGQAAAEYLADSDLDCSVLPGPHGPDVNRCRVQVWITSTDGRPTAAELRDLVGRVGPGGLGRASVVAPEWTATAMSSPALRRTERWRALLQSPDLLAELFGAEERLRE